jgi:hypothetical protein
MPFTAYLALAISGLAIGAGLVVIIVDHFKPADDRRQQRPYGDRPAIPTLFQYGSVPTPRDLSTFHPKTNSRQG